jgi:asparagine synthase (glutamine-hydrolysing)
MCGIAGIAAWHPSALGAEVQRMAQVLAHRGPDDEGMWSDEEAGVALGQRRLAIIDLSPQGHQPMLSASGRYVLSFNGEIYNFAALRERLETRGPVSWRGHSDTEVLLACIEAWGIERTLECAVGMFAISLWDRQTRSLTLARDRLGEKPLYYGAVGARLVFGSELKALTAVSGTGLILDRDSLAEFMSFGYVPAPKSIFRQIRKLPPGHWVQLRSLADACMAPRCYWRPDAGDAARLRADLADATDARLIDAVHHRLSEAVRIQMVSDVPLGAFLSGGVDSSTVVALMQAQSAQRVRTYTIGFAQEGFDEAPFARAVARHLGTDHTELYVGARDAAQLIPNLPTIYDEPFADSSQIPTTLVSHLTRRHVTVSLSGDGGDELFAGYPRYELAARLWRRIARVPMPLRRTVACMLGAPSTRRWDRLLSVLPGARHSALTGRRVHRAAQLLATDDLGSMYQRLMSQWQPEDGLVHGTSTTALPLRHWDARAAPLQAMRQWDICQYLPDDLLAKVDRASMSASLESRAPLLDHRVVELAFALPERALVRDGTMKWVLREVLYRHVPRSLIERPKAGFSVPLGDWLRGPLRDWAEALLEPRLLDADSLLAAPKVHEIWRQHQAGLSDRSGLLWNVLMFQAWRSAVKTGPLEAA